MKKLNNVLLLKQNFLCGAFYYAFEYLDYLLKNNIDIQLILDPFFKSSFRFLIEDKYNLKKIHPNFFKNIIFEKDEIYFIDKLIVLDSTSIYKLNKFHYNILFYNYGDDEKSLNRNFYKKNKKYFIFGDKEMNCKVDYHYPLCLNYNIFKKYKEFENNTREEIFKEEKYFKADHRTIKDFHRTFNKLYYGKNNVWERSNRLIPECKFYNKEIIFEFNDKIDSAQLRYGRPYDYYDIWKFKSPDTNLSFAEFIQK